MHFCSIRCILFFPLITYSSDTPCLKSNTHTPFLFFFFSIRRKESNAVLEQLNIPFYFLQKPFVSSKMCAIFSFFLFFFMHITRVLLGLKIMGRETKFIRKNYTTHTSSLASVELGVEGEGWKKEERWDYIWVNMSIRYFSQSDSSPQKVIFYLSRDVSLNKSKS